MNCPHCGVELIPEVKFCSNCGRTVEGGARTSSSPNPSEQPHNFEGARASDDIIHVALLKKHLSNDEKIQFDLQYGRLCKDTEIAMMLSVFLGWSGVDRFYIGRTGLGFGKLFTVGGFGIWWLVDLFLITKATKEQNIKTANQIYGILVQTRP